MGRIGLSYGDFCRLTFPEFTAVCDAWAEGVEARMRNGWEMTRTHAAITIAPHIDRRHKMTPQRLLPLPWDSERKGRRDDAPRLTPEEQRARARALMERLDKKKDNGR